MVSCWFRRTTIRQTAAHPFLSLATAKPAPAETCSVSFVPTGKLPTQSDPQLMPAGLLVTVPFPSRVMTTVAVGAGGVRDEQVPTTKAEEPPPVEHALPGEAFVVVVVVVVGVLVVGAGCGIGLTVTVNEACALTPALLVAEQLTVVVPTENVEPEGALQVTGSELSA
jgi:hypothetical protein